MSRNNIYNTYCFFRVSSHVTFTLKHRWDECILFLSLLSLAFARCLIQSFIFVFYSQNVNEMYAKSDDDIVTTNMRFVCHRILFLFFFCRYKHHPSYFCQSSWIRYAQQHTFTHLLRFEARITVATHSFFLFIVLQMEKTAIIVCRIGYNILRGIRLFQISKKKILPDKLNPFHFSFDFSSFPFPGVRHEF